MSSDQHAKVDTDWYGDALDLYIPAAADAPAAVVGMRRHGNVITFGVTPGLVIRLSAEQARTIATSLASAAVLADRAAHGSGPTTPASAGAPTESDLQERTEEWCAEGNGWSFPAEDQEDAEWQAEHRGDGLRAVRVITLRLLTQPVVPEEPQP